MNRLDNGLPANQLNIINKMKKEGTPIPLSQIIAAAFIYDTIYDGIYHNIFTAEHVLLMETVCETAAHEWNCQDQSENLGIALKALNAYRKDNDIVN
ncbi:MAG: hypothetical protein JRC93_03980 [Deltaproteobacteria bacterium]|nr:hypothetical protein [Deltaproteobacteria bacterium]